MCVDATIVMECPSMVTESSRESLHLEKMSEVNESVLRFGVDGSTSIKIAPP